MFQGFALCMTLVFKKAVQSKINDPGKRKGSERGKAWSGFRVATLQGKVKLWAQYVSAAKS